MRDVSSAAGLELASQEQLVPFLVCPTKTEEALGELWKLQTVLDMIMLCKAYLHLPIHYLSGYTRYSTACFHQTDGCAIIVMGRCLCRSAPVLLAGVFVLVPLFSAAFATSSS